MPAMSSCEPHALTRLEADVDGDGFVDLLIFTPANESNALYMNLIVSEDDELHLTLDALAAAMSAMQRGAMPRGEK